MTSTSLTTRFDPSDSDEPTAAIVQSLASLEGVSEFDVPPLYRWVDTDALNHLVDGTTTVSIVLTVDGWTVEIDESGTLSVFEVDPATFQQRAAAD